MQESMTEQMDTELEEQESIAEMEAESGAEEQPIPPKRVRRRKKAPFIIGACVILLAGLLIWWLSHGKSKNTAGEVVTDVVSRGSITSMVEGNGQAKPIKSETITLGTSGTVTDVYVTEGQKVAAGTVLYLISSPGADEAVTKARKEVEGYQKQLKTLYEAKQNLNIKPEFSGKLLDVQKVKVGDQVTNGQVLARLVDDSKMKVTQYYSYAYQKSIYVGMPAQVSIPGVMQQLSGKVTEINQVERISAEGAKLFSAVITLNNPGSLTEKMPASALLRSNGEDITPYELGALEYNRVSEVKAKVAGEVKQYNLKDYLKVSASQTLAGISSEDTDNQIFQQETSLKTAQEALTTAEKNKQNLQATAPMDGTVVGLSIVAGDEVKAGTTIVSIVDNSQILVEASIDERSISLLKAGMAAEIDQWGTVVPGTVESVSLSGKFENGMTTFPARILVDNADGRLNSNGSIVYRIQASQSEDCLLLPSQCVKSVANPDTGEAMNVVFVKAEQAPEGAVTVDGASLGVPAAGFFAIPVEVGIADKFNVEILSGVEEGTEVFSQVVQQDSGAMGGLG